MHNSLSTVNRSVPDDKLSLGTDSSSHISNQLLRLLFGSCFFHHYPLSLVAAAITADYDDTSAAFSVSAAQAALTLSLLLFYPSKDIICISNNIIKVFKTKQNKIREHV